VPIVSRSGQITIAYAEVFAILANALPECAATEGDWIVPLPYVRMQEILSFVCLQAGLGNSDAIEKFAALLEMLSSRGEEAVRDLVIDALAGVRGCKFEEIIASRLGFRTKELWNLSI
jgi:hypothetical protein